MIPELSHRGAMLRLPSMRNVPLTERIAALIDHPAFQRLRRVRQLGPIHLVYPGAVHTRFEHSLGVYSMAVRYLRALQHDARFETGVSSEDVECCVLGALLHDIGHYPFAHSLEASHLPGDDTPRHEDLVGDLIFGRVAGWQGSRTLASLVEEYFDVSAQEVVDLITLPRRAHATPGRRLMASIISSGVDADKADYLERDSVHMGVTYGLHHDRERFLDALCVHPEGDRIALTSKGRISAETFLFARYAMFSEGYWHHTVRAVGAMVEEAFRRYRARHRPDRAQLLELLMLGDDEEVLQQIATAMGDDAALVALLGGLTPGSRAIYKRVLTLSRAWEDTQVQQAYERIYHLDARQHRSLHHELCALLGGLSGSEIAPWELLIDTPPRDKDHLETVDIIGQIDGREIATPLENQSQIVRGIAGDFVKVVKKIRVFVHPRVRAALRGVGEAALRAALLDAVVSFRPEPSAQQRLAFDA